MPRLKSGMYVKEVELSPRDIDVMTKLHHAREGSFLAQTQLKMEALSTSDFPAAFQNVNNYVMAKKLTDYQPVWPNIAKSLTNENLKPARELRLDMDTTNLPVANGGIATVSGSLPRIPELTEFPTIGFTASSAMYDTAKNGVRIAFSWEAFKNDDWGQILSLPDEMVKLSTNTQETEIFRQVYGAGGFVTGANTLFPSGTQLSGNPVLSFTALANAMAVVTAQPAIVTGLTPRINTIQEWVLLIPQNLQVTANAILNATQIRQTFPDGTVALVNNPFGNIIPVVVPWIPVLSPGWSAVNTNWALVPKGGEGIWGTTLANVFLRGFEAPELRIKADAGNNFPGGGAMSPFDGSFERDDIQIRLRSFCKGWLLNNGTPKNTAYSTGAGS